MSRTSGLQVRPEFLAVSRSFAKIQDKVWSQAQAPSPLRAEHFSAQEVQCLDARGAFVEHGDPGVPHVLFDTPFIDITVSTKALHTEVGALEAGLSQECLDDRRQEAEDVIGELAGFGVIGLGQYVALGTGESK